MRHEEGRGCRCGEAALQEAARPAPSVLLRVIQLSVTGLFALLAALPVWAVVQDLMHPHDAWFGLGLYGGVMALLVMAALAVPLVLSWGLRSASDGVRSILALVSSTLLLLAAIAVILSMRAGG